MPKREMPTMPFGKHRGEKLNKVPKGYLNWILQNCDHIGHELRADIQAVVDGKPLPEKAVSLNEQVERYFLNSNH